MDDLGGHHLLLERLLDLSDHPVELIAHGLGRNTSRSALEVLHTEMRRKRRLGMWMVGVGLLVGIHTMAE